MDALTRILSRTPCDSNFDSFVEELAAAGYVIVPKEPTREMWAAGGTAVRGMTTVHRDKVAAAPKHAPRRRVVEPVRTRNAPESGKTKGGRDPWTWTT